MRQLITILICPWGECIWKITLKTNCIKTRSMVWGHAVDTGSFLPKQRNPPRPIKRGEGRNATDCTRSPTTLPVTGREAFWARAEWDFYQASDADLSTRREFKSLKILFLEIQKFNLQNKFHFEPYKKSIQMARCWRASAHSWTNMASCQWRARKKNRPTLRKILICIAK